MRKRGITLKLFVMTVIFFLCFYGMVILCQLLFFDTFYQHQKISGVEKHLKTLGTNYAAQKWEGKRLAEEVARFMIRNKTQLAIVTLDGKIKLDDPYHIELLQEDGQHVLVSLSLFMEQFGNELHGKGLQLGDKLVVRGELSEGEEGSPDTIYPTSIAIAGRGIVGYDAEEETVQVSGSVVQLILPNVKLWNQRQGILFGALTEWFPLSPEQIQELETLNMEQTEWTDPWSGIHNAVMIQPVRHGDTDKVELLFAVTSLQEVKDMNTALRWFYLYLGLGGFGLILLLALFYSKMIARPLLTLNATAKRMVSLDFTDFKPLAQKDELGSLSNNLFVLSQNLDAALGQLREANAQLVEEMEHKQRMETVQLEFFANASHELKTPLSIVKGFAEGLADGVSAGKQDHYVKVIMEEAGKMELLVQDMLELARLASGTTRLATSELLLSDLMHRATEKLTHQLQTKQLQTLILPVDESPVLADPAWMEQVALNLMTNAIRHAEEGSTISIAVERQEDTVTLAVRNKGERIPEEQIPQIWERFYRVEPSRSRSTGGTGLGLSIVQRILDLHGCGYGVENVEDGVRFVVTFPIGPFGESV